MIDHQSAPIIFILQIAVWSIIADVITAQPLILHCRANLFGYVLCVHIIDQIFKSGGELFAGIGRDAVIIVADGNKAYAEEIDLLLDVDKALRQFENLSWEKHKLKQLDASIEIQEEVVRKNNTLRLGIYEDLRAGLLDRSEYESLKKELAERIAEATAAIEKLNKEKREILDGVSKQQSWIEQFRQYENVTELTRPMVIHLIERINIFEDSNIEIVFRHRNQIEEILRFISEQTTDKKVLAMPIREVG